MWVREIFWSSFCKGSHDLKITCRPYFQDFSEMFSYSSPKVSMIPLSSGMPSFLHILPGLDQFSSKLNFANKSPGNLLFYRSSLVVFDLSLCICDRPPTDAPGPQTTMCIVGIPTWSFLDIYVLYTLHFLKYFHLISVR